MLLPCLGLLPRNEDGLDSQIESRGRSPMQPAPQHSTLLSLFERLAARNRAIALQQTPADCHRASSMPAAMAGLTSMEKARLERIAANEAKMRSLGITEAASQLQTLASQAAGGERAARPKGERRKRKMFEIEVEVRRSGRIAGEQPIYNEENLADMALGIDRLDLISRPRRRRVGVDPAQLQAIRERRVKEVDGEDAEAPRGPFDSGLGVRIQGGRVYDSKYGVTCHWCRQKTLEEHVTCTHPDCGGGKRLPVSFCKLCLKNRHGEDILQAEASEKWVCPRCRGSCGEGCTLCCNCGPCRKAAGLAPTHQIINQARAAGFENVHDYLVHQKTGESAEEIAARKRAAAWGAWLDVPFNPEAAAAAAASREEVDEQAEEQAAPAQPPRRQSARRRSAEAAAASEPAAAAAAVQLDAAGSSSEAAVPEGAGAALVLYAALRWHLLSGAFASAVQKLASAPKPMARRQQKAAAPAAAKATAAKAATATTKRAAAKPKAAAAPAPKAAAAKAAPRRSARGQAAGQSQATLANKLTSYFSKPAASAAAGKAPRAEQQPTGKAAAMVAAAPATRSNRLGMRARR